MTPPTLLFHATFASQSVHHLTKGVCERLYLLLMSFSFLTLTILTPLIDRSFMRSLAAHSPWERFLGGGDPFFPVLYQQWYLFCLKHPLLVPPRAEPTQATPGLTPIHSPPSTKRIPPPPPHQRTQTLNPHPLFEEYPSPHTYQRFTTSGAVSSYVFLSNTGVVSRPLTHPFHMQARERRGPERGVGFHSFHVILPYASPLPLYNLILLPPCVSPSLFALYPSHNHPYRPHHP